MDKTLLGVLNLTLENQGLNPLESDQASSFLNLKERTQKKVLTTVKAFEKSEYFLKVINFYNHGIYLTFDNSENDEFLTIGNPFEINLTLTED